MSTRQSRLQRTGRWALAVMVALVLGLGSMPVQAMADEAYDEDTMLAEDTGESYDGDDALAADESMPSEDEVGAGDEGALGTSGQTLDTGDALAEAGIDEAEDEDADAGVVPDNDVALDAQATSATFVVRFDANGGTGTMDPLQDCAAGVIYALPQNQFVRQGYEFAAWNTQADGNGTSYANAGQLVMANAGSTGDVTLYAQWRVATYRITYSLGGGTNSAKNPASYTVESAAISLDAPTKTGHKFAGWYADAQLKSKVSSIAAGSVGDKTLYAKWTPNTYGIVFKANGGKGSTRALSACRYDTNVALTANGFARNGYTFASWNTKPDGTGVRYANKASVRNITAKDGDTVSLYAQWSPVRYTITYHLAGGVNSSKNPTAYYVTSAATKLANPTRKGYKFEGWFSDAKHTKRVTSIAKGSTGNKALYAKWTKQVYHIAYKLAGGKNSAKNPKKYSVTTATIKLVNPTRKGYKFGGWFTDAKHTKRVKTIAKGSTGNKVLYAKWTAIRYKITYKLGGGRNSSRNPSRYTIASKKITLASPVRTGYRFGGWFADAKHTKRVKTIAKGSTGNKVVYAKWTANTYRIVYNGNGATSGTMGSQDGLKYGKAYRLRPGKFSRTKKVFVGWNTRSDGKGTSYVNGATVKNLTAKHNGTVVLYAQWEDLVAGRILGYTDYGGVITVTNHYHTNVDVDVSFLYYSGSSLAKTSNAYVYCLEPGQTCALQGWTLDASSYTSWSCSIKWKEASGSLVGNARNISYTSNWGDKNVVVSVRNNGRTTKFTKVAVVFYKDGKVVGYQFHYADVDSPGSTDYLEFSYPYSSNYDTIYPDSYSVYVNESYTYDWSL